MVVAAQHFEFDKAQCNKLLIIEDPVLGVLNIVVKVELFSFY